MWAVIRERGTGMTPRPLATDSMVSSIVRTMRTDRPRMSVNGAEATARRQSPGEFPLVSTPEQAAAAVAATRYPLAGTRSFGPVRRHYDPAAAGAEPLCLAMIETAAGLDSVDRIAATPGLGGLFIGPVDPDRWTTATLPS